MSCLPWGVEAGTDPPQFRDSPTKEGSPGKGGVGHRPRRNSDSHNTVPKYEMGTYGAQIQVLMRKKKASEKLFKDCEPRN